MSDLLRNGSAWLEQMRATHCSSPITYKRGDQSIAVSATFGRTGYQLETQSGLNVGSHVWDFLILAEDLGIEPEPGDVIETDGTTFEVMALGEDISGWRWSDPYRVTYRIHTKETGRI